MKYNIRITIALNKTAKKIDPENQFLYCPVKRPRIQTPANVGVYYRSKFW